jgi:hypothetical protein
MAGGFWPDGEQPVTPPPRLRWQPPQLIIESETPGASLGYRYNGGKWQLYRGPITPGSGEKVEVKAIRYGWQESDIVVAEEHQAR